MNYFECQPYITTGDWIETASDAPVGRKIRDVIGRDVNHSALVIRFTEYEGVASRRFVIEALGKGLELNLLSDLVKDNTFSYWYQLKPEYNHLRAKIGEIMLKEYSDRRGRKKKYDLWDMVKNAWRRVRLDPSAWFCTEWCQWVNGEAGILSPNQCTIAMIPGEIESFQKHQTKVKLTINKEV